MAALGTGDFHLEVREPGRDWSDQEGFLEVVTSERDWSDQEGFLEMVTSELGFAI